MSHQDDLLRREAVRARQIARLGPDPKCRECGWTIYAALNRDRRGIICYDCQNAARGRPIWEEHHPLGHAYPDYTVLVRGNEHRAFHDPVYGELAWFNYVLAIQHEELRRRLRRSR